MFTLNFQKLLYILQKKKITLCTIYEIEFHSGLVIKHIYYQRSAQLQQM